VEASGVRLLAALSFGADLGLGHPTEHVLSQTYIALHLAERLAMDEQEREVVYYAGGVEAALARRLLAGFGSVEVHDAPGDPATRSSSRSARTEPLSAACEVRPRRRLRALQPSATPLSQPHRLCARWFWTARTDDIEPLFVYADPAGHPFCIFVAPA
jgi:hypothetical protein